MSSMAWGKSLETRTRELTDIEKYLQETGEAVNQSKKDAKQKINLEIRALHTILDNHQSLLALKKKEWQSLLDKKDSELDNLLKELGDSDNILDRETATRNAWNTWWNEILTRIQNLQEGGAQKISATREPLEGYFQRGVEAYSKGRPTQSLGHLAQCLDLEPTHEGAWQYRVLCLEALGLKDKAMESAHMVLEINPQNSEMRKWLEQKRGSPK